MKSRKRIRTRMKIAKLDTSKAYIVQVRLDKYISREEVTSYVQHLTKKFASVGLKNVTILPVYKDDGKLTFFEIDDKNKSAEE